MRLKALELQGYKSFANKAQFLFDEGITAVVGPNGSGKSNVADAIRWVLGEQSYSNLRGKKTEDMIFSGSDGRARLGMATATLVLDNNDRWLPLDFSEVTISRRAYRSGENEYYLNNSRVRLRDISELLSKSGLSRQTYTVIGQGTIDRVLSLQSEERRRLFEEAAGITFHRQKRAETLARLEETHANLLRLNDIVKEIEPQLGRLEKQALRADEHARLMLHLEGLLRVWYGYRWGQGQEGLREAKSRLRDSENAVAVQRGKLGELEAEIHQLRTEQNSQRSRLGGWYTESNQLRTQAERVQRELAVSEERARGYQAQRDEILADLEPLVASLAGQEERVAEVQAALRQVNEELAQAQQIYQQVRRQLDAHQARRQEVLARQAAAEKQARQRATELAERQARLAQFEERRSALAADQANSDTEIARLTGQQKELQSQQAALAAEVSKLERELAELTRQENEARESLAGLNRAAEGLRSQQAGLHRQEDALKARQDVLGRLRSDLAGYYEGVRAVLQPEARLRGLIGTVSQVLRVTPDLELALETALSSRVQDVVVETFADAEAAISYLKEQRRGRATFLPLDTLRPGPALNVPARPGVIGLATELVEVEPRLRPIAELTLNRTVIVEDLPAARRVFKELQGGFQIVTRDGELMRSGGAVTGGRAADKKGEGGTLLAREREWRELPAQIETVAREQRELAGQIEANRAEVKAMEVRLQGLAAEQRQKNGRRQEVQAVADKAGRAVEQLTSSIGWQRDLQNRAGAELEKLDRRETDTRQEIETLDQARQAAETTARDLATEAGALSNEALLAEQNTAQTNLATIQGRQKSQQALLENHEATRRQLAGQIEGRQARAQSLAAERKKLLGQQAELQTRNEALARQLAEFTAQMGEAESRLAELETRLRQLGEAEQHLRHRVQRLEAEYNRVSLEAARRQDELDHLQRQIQDDLGLVHLEMTDEQIGQPVLPIRPLVSDLPVIEELPPGVEEDVRRLKVQVRRLGNINPEAPREYAEMRERYDFLTGQMADLEAAAGDLKEIIARLDGVMEEAFTATFQKVAREFQRYFKALFGGGEAKLILTEPDSPTETGVDIVARPPGKRLQSLGLLSGGERSLTAQALIFALLKVSPTPFVIFDEVDAMLDEANVVRFRDALSALASEIQFIVITHNRKTIEAANTLYGVSMGGDSVSQVYSLKIEEWLSEKTLPVRGN